MMQTTVLRLPTEDKHALELEAQQKGVSLAEIVRKAIKSHLTKQPKQKSAVENLLEWAERSEKYKSKFKAENISANYKEYLYGAKSPEWGYLWKQKKKK